MHLLLGYADDPCCRGVHEALLARGCSVRVIANPLTEPSRFAWRLDDLRSDSELTWDDTPVSSHEISSVLVRTIGWIDPAGWKQGDLAYIQSEMQAALLAWLWSLPCPVINRYPASLWYRLSPPPLAWHGVLLRAGLRMPPMLVTNVEGEAQSFRRQLAAEGMPGAIYGPLTTDSRYLVKDDADWSGVAALQRHAPVCLAFPHGAAHMACAVGGSVVWDEEPPAEMAAIEPAIQRFADLIGLAFVGVAVASTAKGAEVVAVEPFPELRRFGEAARRHIIERLADVLTARNDSAYGDVAARARRPVP